MSFEKISKVLVGDSPGRSTELTYFRIGPDGATKKVYLQAAIHADEQPGILILHHLLQLLRQADANAELNAQFVLFPMVNPLGMGDIEFARHQGRYNRSTGVNHNRAWPDLYQSIESGFGENLGDNAEQNTAAVRAALRNWVDEMPNLTAVDQWRQILYSEACDADYVFDVHCDDDSLLHIFGLPQLQESMQELANWTGAAATLMAEDSGGGTFDEVWPAVWLQLVRENPGKPLPLPVVSCTLEYRGQFDTFDDLNRDDAEQLYGYFQAEGLITGKVVGSKHQAPAATDFRATEMLRAPMAGLLVYKVELGERVASGDCIAELLHLDGDGAFVDRTPVLTGTTGLVLSRSINKYVWRNANIAKIVGTEILPSRSGYLLSD